MSPNSQISNLLARNKYYYTPITTTAHKYHLLNLPQKFAQDYNPAPSFKDLLAKQGPTGEKIVIVSCFDARANPQKYFGLQAGEALIISNAGGRVDDSVIRTLILSVSLLGVGSVIIVHHTDCGLCNISDEEIRMKMKEQVPEKAMEVECMRFGEFKDPYESIKEDVGILKRSPFVGKRVEVLGFVFDVKHGTVKEVKTE